MNKILEMKGKFNKSGNKPGGSGMNLPSGNKVTSDKMVTLAKNLNKVLREWDGDSFFDGILISVRYKQVLAKTHRIQHLLKKPGTDVSKTIRGAKFEKIDGKTKHIFIHLVTKEAIKRTIDDLMLSAKIVDKRYGGVITDKDIKIIDKKEFHKHENISATRFVGIIVESFYVEEFLISRNKKEVEDNMLVTLYDTNTNYEELFNRLDLDIKKINVIDKNSFILNKESIKRLQDVVPYLIAEQVRDLNKIETTYTGISSDGVFDFGEPSNEPYIGVFDTQFDENCIFSKWVDYHNILDSNITIDFDDKNHGTAVASILACGHLLNPELDDECGMFRVKFFGVATKDGFYWPNLCEKIENVILKNSDIKVWNLSLGSSYEVDENYISPVAAKLDELQNKYDVIFVVSGTNKDSAQSNRIGSPADSLNSIVVNSVDLNNNPASYTRTGPVLSFFRKPDVAYYGGDKNEQIVTIDTKGRHHASGTSFAAPWISRKVAFLIYKMNLSREVAKALIIDSAAGWKTQFFDVDRIGYGIVPIKISDILSSKNDEIRFVLDGKAEDYMMYNYELPVPVTAGKYYYVAKATLCYFPKGERLQGVDYTTSEMNLTFGRMTDNTNNKGEIYPTIKPIDNNIQDVDCGEKMYEAKAREVFRKWDNIKHICQKSNGSLRGLSTFGYDKWGIRITTKDRLERREGIGLKYGIVITLKHIKGQNTLRTFIDMCRLNQWFVNEVDIDNRVDISNMVEEDIVFND